MENTKNLEEQKKNIERSITQLKNYYEMEKERLEKRILEDRKKH
jgi:gas vesicle protein